MWRGELEDLVKDPSKPFFREGPPRAKIHGRLLDHTPEQDFKDLLNFRGEGSPSLQMVIAVPPVGSPHTHPEFDIDKGNALQDVLGFVVHLGELLDGKPTNHMEFRKTLAKTKAAPFLDYKVTEASGPTASPGGPIPGSSDRWRVLERLRPIQRPWLTGDPLALFGDASPTVISARTNPKAELACSAELDTLQPSRPLPPREGGT